LTGLEPVREENIKHSQYATTMENLKNIFNVDICVEKTLQLIEEDNLLNAHQCLVELENSRDDLLYELHKQPKQYAKACDKITLKRHFEKVETVSKRLEKKIRLILFRTLKYCEKRANNYCNCSTHNRYRRKSRSICITAAKSNRFSNSWTSKKMV